MRERGKLRLARLAYELSCDRQAAMAVIEPCGNVAVPTTEEQSNLRGIKTGTWLRNCGAERSRSRIATGLPIAYPSATMGCALSIRRILRDLVFSTGKKERVVQIPLSVDRLDTTRTQ